ncbi:MAG: type VI secretion system lipoprotein TssJ [Ignavibacteriota bacterium]|jgi:type VI secretion system VasD/TssJ family lipoprotein|nr:MAG: type VI secretion system lipoprotein TssJ [Ignavibacterium sp.]MBL1154051.1 type VI secretion system lipoprotein TssJ [Ignavibacteriota bacterium]MCO6448659.1 type VI secretion system lipoprotein TssJ [Ignavibacterium album]MCZ2268945.1 type VI secretion system lipoprotein TssJ [Ignavibacteriales bacterium]MDX9712223.1 type VI secretion system lipoprotein TssJ [Ignavibacteriaceae bacterium]
MKKIILILLPVFTLLLFSKCGSGKEYIQVSFKSYDNSNGGNAVVVTIYQLANADKFRLSSFESLTKNAVAALGSDLIPNSVYEKTMVPGESFNLDELEIKKEAAFLGVMADFHSPSADGWQSVVDLKDGVDKLIVKVQDNSISVQVDN